MTPLEIILLCIIYIFIGIWVTHKENNSVSAGDSDPIINIIIFFLWPFFIIIEFYDNFIIRKWE